MTIGGKYKNNNFSVVNFIYQSMFVTDTTTPLTGTVAGKLLGFPCTSTRVLVKLCNQLKSLFVSLLFALQKFFEVILSLLGN